MRANIGEVFRLVVPMYLYDVHHRTNAVVTPEAMLLVLGDVGYFVLFNLDDGSRYHAYTDSFNHHVEPL